MKTKIIHGRFIMARSEAWRFALIKTITELSKRNLLGNNLVSVEPIDLSDAPYTDKLYTLENYEISKLVYKSSHNKQNL